MTNELPKRAVVRSCRNCKFYTAKFIDNINGWCLLEQTFDPAAKQRTTSTELVCSAHLWRTPDRLRKLQLKYDADYDE
mgnify:FL=1